MENKKFTLTHTIPDISELNDEWSVKEIHFNVPWKLHIFKGSSPQTIGVYLYCCKEKGSNLWNIRANSQITMKSATTETTDEASTETYKDGSLNWGKEEELDEEVYDMFEKDREVTITCNVHIHSIVGIRQKRKLCFDAPHEMMTDVVMVVENKKFHVSKVMLSNSSPVFLRMFSSGFKESQENVEVHVADVKESVFQTFLMLIYHCRSVIDENNVEDLLKLADFYQVDSISERCEQFLLGSGKIDKKTKLRLAEQFLLVDLQKRCLDTLHSAKDIKKLEIHSEDMSEATIRALYAKLVKFA